MADQINYYEVLGVRRDASQAEIRNAYRRLAKERHPDSPGGDAREFALLQEAHEVLSDPERRRRHDEELDLAYAAAQLSDLDFSKLEDELASRRAQREAEGGPGFGERLRNRLRRRKRGARGDNVRVRGRYEIREARWYEPHHFEPEPVNWKTGALSFAGSFAAFIAAGQVGLWATGIADPGPLVWLATLAPFMPLVYTLVGLLAAYFAYRAAGYWGVALVFVAALVVGGQGGPVGLLQFATLGIALLLLAIYLGNRRAGAARR